MKKFFLKCLAFLAFAALYFFPAFYIDTFNVFHWKNIRFTKAEANKNFVKTKYVLSSPERFNAFAFGSSRVGNLDMASLPADYAGVSLSWYNMTYSNGTPKEHCETLKSFLRGGVDVRFVVVEFDEISMYELPEEHRGQLIRNPYQSYEEDPFAFYLSYLKKAEFSLLGEVLSQKSREDYGRRKELFYRTGQELEHINFSPRQEFEEVHFATRPSVWPYSYRGAAGDIAEIASLCRDNGIEVVFFTSPLYKDTYAKAVAGGYFEFLKDVAEVTPFYNFSELNGVTEDWHYYWDWSHYNASVGKMIVQSIFGGVEGKAAVRKISPTFGQRVDASNVDAVLDSLPR